MPKKQTAKKKEAYFIATKQKNRPMNVTFYTKDGKKVAFGAVEKKHTKEGVQFFTTTK
jgi:hypothetical protein